MPKTLSKGLYPKLNFVVVINYLHGQNLKAACLNVPYLHQCLSLAPMYQKFQPIEVTRIGFFKLLNHLLIARLVNQK